MEEAAKKIEAMSFLERVTHAQNELKAPKNQHNKFGNYDYRSAEDILEAVKPINVKYGLHLFLEDNIEMLGDRFYLKVTAVLSDSWNKDNSNAIRVTSFARETQAKKGMDEAQITGSASSYARKYALNGLYLIDDTKDADTNEQRDEMDNRRQNKQQNNNLITGKQLAAIKENIRRVAEAAGSDMQPVLSGLLQELQFNGTIDNLPENLVGKANSILVGWKKRYEQQQKQNIDWGRA